MNKVTKLIAFQMLLLSNGIEKGQITNISAYAHSTSSLVVLQPEITDNAVIIGGQGL